MYIYFNEQGIPTTQVFNGEIVRQNSTFNIFITFDKKFYGKNKILTIKFKRPADKDFGTEFYLEDLGLQLFEKKDTSENSYNLIDGEKYYTYFLKVNKDFQLTNDYGNVISLITLYESDSLNYNEDNTVNLEDFTVKSVILEGKINFYIEPTLGDSNNNSITPPQYDYLMTVVGNLIKSGDGFNERLNVVDNLNSQSSTDALSARQGNLLHQRITVLEEKPIEKVKVVDNLFTQTSDEALSAKQGYLLNQRLTLLEESGVSGGGNIDLTNKADLDFETKKLVISQLPTTHYVGKILSNDLITNGIFYKEIKGE